MSKLKLEWRENPDGSWKAQANRCHVTLTSEPSGFPGAVDGHEWEYRYTTPVSSGLGVSRGDLEAAKLEAQDAVSYSLQL